MLVKNFIAQKGSKTTPITYQIVSTNWTGHPFQNAKKIEKDREKITILVNIGDQEQTYQHPSDSQLLFAYPHANLQVPIPKGKELSIPAHSWLLLHETKSAK